MTTQFELEKDSIRNKTAKPLLWVGMAGMTMIFGSLTSAYVVRQADSDWLSIDLPLPFYYSTAIILLSSITLIFADFSIKKNNLSGLKWGMGATFVLSLFFVYSQFYAYGYMHDHGMNFTGGNISSSFLIALTIVHLAHVFGGNISLLITFINSLRNKYSANTKLGVELVSWYWHYLTVIWLFLLAFIIYIK